MKKSIRDILIVFLGANAILLLKRPITTYLSAYADNELNLSLAIGIFIRLLIIAFTLNFINRLELKRFNGLRKGSKIYNLQAIIIPLAIILMGFFSNYGTYVNANWITFSMFLISVIAIGFAEEFIFRGLIFPIFLKLFRKKKSVLFLGAIVSSLMFGLVHYANLISQPSDFSGITSQVIFAFSIGVFFSGLMLRTSSIIIPSLVHAFINFSFGASKIKPEKLNQIAEVIEDGMDWNRIIPTAIIFSFIFLGGVFMIKKCDKQEILLKVSNEKNVQII